MTAARTAHARAPRPIASRRTLTRAELEQGGITKGIAQSWAQFYRAVVIKTPNNPSALGRAELMEHAVELLP